MSEPQTCAGCGNLIQESPYQHRKEHYCSRCWEDLIRRSNSKALDEAVSFARTQRKNISRANRNLKATGEE